MKSLLCLLFSALFPLAAVAQNAQPKGAGAPEDTDFIRFTEDDKRGRLQTAMALYRDPEGRQVWLLGVVHVGDKKYYQRFNRDFTTCDAVLYEMVGADTDGPLTKEQLQGDKDNPLRFFQKLLTSMLELDYQLDHIDYTARNLVHADMSMEAFKAKQAEKGENLITLMQRTFEHQLKRAKKEGGAEEAEPAGLDFAALLGILTSNKPAAGLKLLLGRQFHDIEDMLSGIEGTDGSVILTERNKVVIDVLKKTLAGGKRKVAIFYGAAHMPDLEKRLVNDMGYKRIAIHWRTAWDIDKTKATPKADESPAEADENAQPAPGNAPPEPEKKAFIERQVLER